VHVGASPPLGATITAEGVNFSGFSKRTDGINLLLFDHVDAATSTLQSLGAASSSVTAAHSAGHEIPW